MATDNGTTSLLRELRDRDTETGLLTDSRVYRALLAEIARSERYGNPLSGVLVQVQGLEAGKQTARFQLANRLATVMRNTDYAGTWGEDRFLLVLPETDESGARRFTGKVETELSERAATLEGVEGPPPAIAARVTAWQRGDDAEALLGRLETAPRA